ncbi:hypothetical protein EZS27_028459, partial [termite gut metagenome]
NSGSIEILQVVRYQSIWPYSLSDYPTFPSRPGLSFIPSYDDSVYVWYDPELENPEDLIEEYLQILFDNGWEEVLTIGGWQIQHRGLNQQVSFLNPLGLTYVLINFWPWAVAVVNDPWPETYLFEQYEPVVIPSLQTEEGYFYVTGSAVDYVGVILFFKEHQSDTVLAEQVALSYQNLLIENGWSLKNTTRGEQWQDSSDTLRVEMVISAETIFFYFVEAAEVV